MNGEENLRTRGYGGTTHGNACNKLGVFRRVSREQLSSAALATLHLLKGSKEEIKVLQQSVTETPGAKLDVDLYFQDRGAFLGVVTTCGRSSAQSATMGDTLVIKSLLPGQAAWMDGRLQIGDVITHVNSESIKHMSQPEAVAFIRSVTDAARGTTSPVVLSVHRPKTPQQIERLSSKSLLLSFNPCKEKVAG